MTGVPLSSSSPQTSAASASLLRAKRPRSVLAGPYGHPFHPMLATVPIGAWVASLVFDVAAFVGNESEVFARGAYWLIIVGIVGALLAALFGLLDLSGIPRGSRAQRTGLAHLGLNAAVIVLFGVNVVLRRAQGIDEATAAGIALSIVTLATLGASGWLGGRLAYRYGVRVADEGTQAEGYR